MPIPLEEIRQQEKAYHDQYYAQHELFSEDSWLDDPVAAVIDGFSRLPDRSELRILDLGCGVGRNSIPLAQRLRNPKDRIVCVDLLDSAIDHLQHYAQVHGVADHIQAIRSDAEHYPITADTYDYVIAVSVLEHLSQPAVWYRTIASMQLGTRQGGIHVFEINTDITETDMHTGERLTPMFELLFSSDTVLADLHQHYTATASPWSIIQQRTSWHSIEIEREGRSVRLDSNMLTWVAQKP